MTDLKAVIIDDELNSIDVLKILIDKYCPNVKVVGEAESADSGRNLIKTLSPEIVFLDIEMPLGSGFDVLNKIEQKDFQIIFITAYNHYALKAIKYSALDYLLKPVDIDELIAAVNKAAARLHHHHSNEALDLLATYLKKDKGTNKIAIPTADGLEFVEAYEVVRCEAYGNYTKMYLLDNRVHVIARTLKEYEEVLHPHHFLRVHHAHLINLNHIEKYVKGEGGYAIMADGSMVDISKRRKAEFLARFSSGV